jgi:Zn-dependent protease
MLDVNLAHLLVWYLVFVFSTTCHEYAHALAAFKGGDETAYEGGQLSLDPIPHIKRSPFGMVLVPLLTFVAYAPAEWMLGWASVPYDPGWGQRHPKRQALMSLAGPATNLLLAALALVAIKVLLGADVFERAGPEQLDIQQLVVAKGDPAGTSTLSALAMALSIMVSLNVLLGLFNLIPVPPLDGAGVAEGFGPRSVVRVYEKFREYPMLGLLGLVVAWRYFHYVGVPALNVVLDLTAW